MSAWPKRIFFFVVVNALVLLTLNITLQIVANVFGYQQLLSYQGDLIFAVVLGMSGAIISLLMSKTMAKMMMRVKIIDPNTMNTQERRLLQRVHEYARMAGLKKMPEVGIYDSPEVNAFATGPSKNNSLVACSTGILHAMDSDELDGVLAHEVAHIANGDMVTMTLIQGIINTLTIFIARIVARMAVQNDDSKGMGTYLLIYYGLYFALSVLGGMVVNFFSRWREYRADAGSARIAGREKMVKALKRLQANYNNIDTSQEAIATLKISNRPTGLMAKLFSTHPPLQERIARLETGHY